MATFNLPLGLKNQAMVKVYKNPAGDNDGKEVTLNDRSVDVAVNADNKNLLEITLPAVAANEIYRLKLEAGAVNAENKPDNANKAIAPKNMDITIGAAPVLVADKAPYLSGQKIIVPFDGPIIILDPGKIKYRFAANAEADFSAAIKPANPKAVNNNQLEIPLNNLLVDGQVYRIELKAGALSGGKNKASMDAITSRDITVIEPTLTNVKPVFDSNTQFRITFPVAVDIVGDGSTIKVQKKDDKDDPDTLADESNFRTVSSRNIAVDGTDTKKINITLTAGEVATPYTQVWKVDFPKNTVETATSKITNSSPLTTEEGVLRLTDLYSWEEVPTSGSSKWLARNQHTSVVFNGKIWVLGGYNGKNLNDVWSSPDGATWTELTPKDKNGNTVAKETAVANKNWWTARYLHTSVAFKDKIWVMGGDDNTGKKLNDVWSSPDGATWTELTPKDKNGNTVAKETAVANKNWWTARHLHTSVVFKDKIWIIGGLSVDFSNDVWSSTDGSTWMEEDNNTSMIGDFIYKHTSAVFKGKIWVIGGEFVGNIGEGKSVWSSTKGKTWNKGTANLPNAVNYAKAVKYKDRLWSFGGGINQKKSFWSSANPATGWTAENTLSSNLTQTQAVVFKNRIWLLGGYYDGTRTDKVWKMGTGTE